MSDTRDRPEDPEVGSVGEEAAKLFGAVSEAMGWPGGAGADQSADPDRPQTDPGNPQPSLAETLATLAGQAAGAWREVESHVATGAEECRYCPVCRAVHAVRQSSPEVRTHLGTAVRSLLDAAGALLADVTPPGGSRDGVERIDLDDPENPEENW